MVGQHRRIVLGKHSGCRAVRAKLNECGIDVTKDELCKIVEQVKSKREEGKYINDKLFNDIVDRLGDHSNFNHLYFHIFCNNKHIYFTNHSIKLHKNP